MSDTRSLIVVADRETAHFFVHHHPGATLEGHGPSVEQPSVGDRNADRPGRAFDSHGAGRHAMEPPSSYQDLERQSMAAEIGKRVADHFHADEVDRLVLIADPKLLGELRTSLDPAIRDRIALELGKHLTQATTDELAERLTEDGSIGLVRARA